MILNCILYQTQTVNNRCVVFCQKILIEISLDFLLFLCECLFVCM